MNWKTSSFAWSTSSVLFALSTLSLLACDDLQPVIKVVQAPTTDAGPAVVTPSTDPNVPAGALLGETKTLFGGSITNWATLVNGKIATVSWTLPLATVEGVPDTTMTDQATYVTLPPEVGQQTVFQGLDYTFLPHGHSPPGVYDTPHWEFHATQVTAAEFSTIDCSDESNPPPALLPLHWFMAPLPNNCFPRMGIHAFNIDAPELNQEKFTKSFSMAYYHAKWAAYEPKASKEYLLTRQTFSVPVPDMRLLGIDKLYPTTCDVVYDSKDDEYVFTFGGFVGLMK